MPRTTKLRKEFENGDVLVNEFGQETARLTLNGLLVINLSELFFEIERQSATHGWCPITRLNMAFGRTGTWASDPSVYAAVQELADLKTIEIGNARVRPVMTATKALKKIPKYVTSMELLAGLEEVND
jgi:hypothetical protein